MPTRRTLLAVLATTPLATSRATRAAPPLKIVASFSIIADLVRQIGGPRVQVTTLVGADQDMHAFQPRPSDAQAIAAADLFVINGLDFETWAERLAAAAGYKKPGIVATRGIRPLPAGSAHGQGSLDPHAWQDATNVKLYAANIRDGLITADPAGADDYRRNATALLARLDALDADIKAAFRPIPRASRKIVTSHDAFRYYGDAYDVDFRAPLGLSGDAEPSAQEFAALIGQIRREGIRALFLENTARSPLLQQIARETGVRIGGTLYSDALSAADGPAASYEAMMRHNTRMIVAALA